MNKHLVKGWVILGVITISLTSLNLFNEVNATSSEFGENQFALVGNQDTIIDNNIITPYSTWYGNLGSSRLDYMNSNKSFSWGINLKKKTPIVFAGTIKIYTQSTGSHRGTIYISGGGIGSTGGVAKIPSNIKLRKGVAYRAEYSGKATGSGVVLAWIPKKSSISFVY